MTPAGTSNELDVQNKWKENTRHISYLLTHVRVTKYYRYVPYNVMLCRLFPWTEFTADSFRQNKCCTVHKECVDKINVVSTVHKECCNRSIIDSRRSPRKLPQTRRQQASINRRCSLLCHYYYKHCITSNKPVYPTVGCCSTVLRGTCSLRRRRKLALKRHWNVYGALFGGCCMRMTRASCHGRRAGWGG